MYEALLSGSFWKDVKSPAFRFSTSTRSMPGISCEFESQGDFAPSSAVLLKGLKAFTEFLSSVTER
jgi:hypothetical protein